VNGSAFSPRSTLEQTLTTAFAAAGFERLRTVIETDMVWHERTHRHAVHVWLRDTLRNIIPGTAATGMDIRLEN
jgi:hypothetical protein